MIRMQKGRDLPSRSGRHVLVVFHGFGASVRSEDCGIAWVLPMLTRLMLVSEHTFGDTDVCVGDVKPVLLDVV